MARTDRLYDNPRSKKLRDEKQEAKKGDERDVDVDQPRDGTQIKGRYESIGREGRRKGDPEEIDEKDKKEMSDSLDAWLKGGKKGPAPVFKSIPTTPDQEEDKGHEFYELWRRKKGEVPTS